MKISKSEEEQIAFALGLNLLKGGPAPFASLQL
jgi:hypothetical protein